MPDKSFHLKMPQGGFNLFPNQLNQSFGGTTYHTSNFYSIADPSLLPVDHNSSSWIPNPTGQFHRAGSQTFFSQTSSTSHHFNKSTTNFRHPPVNALEPTLPTSTTLREDYLQQCRQKLSFWAGIPIADVTDTFLPIGAPSSQLVEKCKKPLSPSQLRTLRNRCLWVGPAALLLSTFIDRTVIGMTVAVETLVTALEHHMLGYAWKKSNVMVADLNNILSQAKLTSAGHAKVCVLTDAKNKIASAIHGKIQGIRSICTPLVADHDDAGAGDNPLGPAPGMDLASVLHCTQSLPTAYPDGLSSPDSFATTLGPTPARPLQEGVALPETCGPLPILATSAEPAARKVGPRLPPIVAAPESSASSPVWADDGTATVQHASSDHSVEPPSSAIAASAETPSTTSADTEDSTVTRNSLEFLQHTTIEDSVEPPLPAIPTSAAAAASIASDESDAVTSDSLEILQHKTREPVQHKNSGEVRYKKVPFEMSKPRLVNCDGRLQFLHRKFWTIEGEESDDEHNCQDMLTSLPTEPEQHGLDVEAFGVSLEEYHRERTSKPKFTMTKAATIKVESVQSSFTGLDDDHVDSLDSNSDTSSSEDELTKPQIQSWFGIIVAIEHECGRPAPNFTAQLLDKVEQLREAVESSLRPNEKSRAIVALELFNQVKERQQFTAGQPAKTPLVNRDNTRADTSKQKNMTAGDRKQVTRSLSHTTSPPTATAAIRKKNASIGIRKQVRRAHPHTIPPPATTPSIPREAVSTGGREHVTRSASLPLRRSLRNHGTSTAIVDTLGLHLGIGAGEEIPYVDSSTDFVVEDNDEDDELASTPMPPAKRHKRKR